jgi:hypothetical protein
MGIVTNASKNPVSLPDGSMLGAGESREDFDESTLKDDMFFKAGWLVTGKDAKELQAQLDDSDVTTAALKAKVEELQGVVADLTLRAEAAEAKLKK